MPAVTNLGALSRVVPAKQGMTSRTRSFRNMTPPVSIGFCDNCQRSIGYRTIGSILGIAQPAYHLSRQLFEPCSRPVEHV